MEIPSLVSQQGRVYDHIAHTILDDLLVGVAQIDERLGAFGGYAPGVVGCKVLSGHTAGFPVFPNDLMKCVRIKCIVTLKVYGLQQSSNRRSQFVRYVTAVRWIEKPCRQGPDVPLDLVPHITGGPSLPASRFLGGILLLQSLDLLGPAGPLFLNGRFDLLPALLPQLGNPLLVGCMHGRNPFPVLLPQLGNPLLVGCTHGRNPFPVLLPEVCNVLPVGFS